MGHPVEGYPLKTYKCLRMFLFIFSGLCFLTLVGIYIGIAKLSSTDPVWFYILWMCFLVWSWYEFMKLPYEITIRNGNSIQFCSVLKRVTISPHEIESIKAWGAGTIKIKHKDGAIRMVAQMNGFHDFISTVMSLNPSIELKGL